MFATEALTDPALYQGVLYVAAAHTDGLYGHGISPNTLRYRGEAIRLVNLKLHKAAEVVSDFTIATVAMLVVNEVGNNHLVLVLPVNKGTRGSDKSWQHEGNEHPYERN